MRTRLILLITLIAFCSLAISTARAEVPARISVGGQLTDSLGVPVAAGSRDFTFKIFDAASGGTELWPAGAGETQTVTIENAGTWATDIGTLIPLTQAAFADSTRWLEITIDDGINPPETLSRIRLNTNPFAFRVSTVDGSTGGVISGNLSIQSDLSVSGKATIGPGHLSTAPDAFVAGANNTVLGTASSVGGSFNTVTGNYSVVAGGGGFTAADSNVAHGSYATIGGGLRNRIAPGGSYGTIGGGAGNSVSAQLGTVVGGEANSASAFHAFVGGGNLNTASGIASTVPGGILSVAGGQYSLAAGNRAKANHDGSMVLVAGASTFNSDSTRSGGNSQMVLRANGGMYLTNTGGLAPYDTSRLINTSVGAYLSTAGIWQNAVYAFPGADGTGGQVMTTDGSGQLDWTDPVGGNSGWTDDGAAVRLTNSTDSVGIGTATPAARLEIVGDLLVTDKATIGSGNTNSGVSSFVAGQNNAISGDYSVIAGGGGPAPADSNSAIGAWSVIGGGQRNSATDAHATVAGGYVNTAEAAASSVGGGLNNAARGPFATISGGFNNNSSTDSGTTIGGGQQNAASSVYATVGGGRLNQAIGRSATVAGGYSNQALSTSSTVAGGQDHVAFGLASTVGGGGYNQTNGAYTTIGGGNGNIASGEASFIGGGVVNFTGDSAATIGGGRYNLARAKYAVIAGGGGSDAIDSNSASGAWSAIGGGSSNTATGFFGTVSGGNFNKALSFGATVSGGQNNVVTGPLSTVGGGSGHFISASRATIGGGGTNDANADYSTVSGGSNNSAEDTAATVGGGSNNKARGRYAVVAGGGGGTAADSNSASGNWSVITGGSQNTATGVFSTVSGGNANVTGDTSAVVSGGAYNYARGLFSVIAGGGGRTDVDSNVASGEWSIVSGGARNAASGFRSIIPGGFVCVASGNRSFAVGTMANAVHNGSFVFADGVASAVSSSADNQFSFRASGGVTMFTNSALTSGVTLAAGGSSWSAVSDSAMKENIRQVDGEVILDRLARLPISRWNYKAQDRSIEHIGPMAQDFYRLFGLGEDDRHINTLDPDGVALAAIQALYRTTETLKAKTDEIDLLRAEVAELKSMLETAFSATSGDTRRADVTPPAATTLSSSTER